MQYDDFVIQIGSKQGSDYRVRVLSSPAGEGDRSVCATAGRE
ncbi:MAG: hypothetical protein AAGD06_10185 [Acidobacteriota bacterium]